MDTNIEFHLTSDRDTIMDALWLIEEDHPHLSLHEWVYDVTDWTDVHFNLCFKDNEYAGYYCYCWDGSDYWIHFGMMNNLNAKRGFLTTWKHVKEEMKNHYGAEKLVTASIDSSLVRIIKRLGWEYLDGNKYIYELNS